MSAGDIVGLIIAGLLAVYLIIALVLPDRFS